MILKNDVGNIKLLRNRLEMKVYRNMSITNTSRQREQTLTALVNLLPTLNCNMFSHPSESYLVCEGRLTKNDGTAYANAEADVLTN